MDNETLESSIINWVNTFSLKNQINCIKDLSDGTVFLEILNDINSLWFNSLKSMESESEENWVVRFNRLKKIYKLISSYFEEELGQSISDIETPNFNLISKEYNSDEIIKLAQLILALAVQSENNKDYISKITSLNQSSQQWLMIIIEQVMNQLKKVNDSTESLPTTSSNDNTINLLKAERDELIESKKELAMSLENLKKQNKSILQQKSALENKVRDIESQLESVNKAGKADIILKSEISNLKTKLDLSEEKCQEMELLAEKRSEVISDLEKKIEEFSRKADEAGLLKDQMDEFEHIKNRLTETESMLEKYKRKLEESADLNKQLKNLQEENKMQYEKTHHLEEEYLKVSSIKSLAKEYKEQILSLEKKKSELIIELQRAKFEIKENEKKVQSLEEDNAQSITLIQELQDRISELELNDYGSSTNEYQVKLQDELNYNNNKEIEEKIKSLTKSKEKLDKDNMELYKENLMLKSKLAHQNVEYNEEANNVVNDELMKEYKDEITLLNEKLENYENAIEIVKSGGDLMESNAFIDLQNENKKLKKKIEEILVESKSQKEEIIRLNNENENLKKSDLDLKQLTLSQKNINKNLNTTLESLKNPEKTDLEIQLTKRTNQYYRANEKVAQLTNALNIARNYITVLDEKIKKIYNENKSKNELIEKLESEILKRENEIKSLRDIYEREEKLISYAWYDVGLKATYSIMENNRNCELNPISFLGKERQNTENNLINFKNF